MSEEKKVYTLHQLARSIKHALETKTGDKGFWVKAEIAKVTFHKSGHVYFDFVQESDGVKKAAIRGSIWKSSLHKIKSDLGNSYDSVIQNGSEIVFRCKVTFHEIHGLNIVISEIDISFMIGELEKRKADTIKTVKSQGVHLLNKQRALPSVIHKIALIGSPDTSGFRDFAHHVIYNEWRFRYEINVISSPVQGAAAAAKLCEALRQATEGKPDVIVLVRGGGSPLDLDCFNDLKLALAIGNTQIPILTGIGHETDFTVADLVSHEYFKTPTDVGDYIVDKTSFFASKLIEIATVIGSRSRFILNREVSFLSNSKILLSELPVKLIAEKLIAFNRIKEDLNKETLRTVEKRKERLANLSNTISLLNPVKTLARGYSIVRNNEKAITSTSQLSLKKEIEIQMKDGFVSAEVTKIKTTNNEN